MTPDKQRDHIKMAMAEAGLTAGAVIIESKFTGLRHYLNDGNITDVNLYAVKQAIKRLTERKAEVKK